MFGTILEQSIFLYVIAATGICGIVAKLVMDGFLKGLVRGAGSMKSTKKKALVEIRKRYEELSYLDVGIRDTRSFVEKYIYKLKLGKSYVSSWNSFCSNMMILAAGTGLIGTWWEYRTGSSVFASVQIGMWGIVACGVMQMVYNIFNTRRKCEMLSAELVSYMNNSLANRLKREQEKQMESSKQKADDRSRSGLKQTAAAIIEPNVIDIDAALAQMGEQKDRRNEKKAEAERRKSRETDIKKKDLQAVAETEPENKDGRLYTRLKYSDALFNSGYFITEPVLVGEEEVRGHLLDCDWQAVGYTVVHDRGTAANPRNRLAAVFDFRDFWGVNYAGYAAVFPEADKGWPDGFVPLNDLGDHELIYFRGWGDWSGGYYYMILKTPGGKYLQQTFTLKRSTAELYYEEGSLAVQELPSGFVYEDCLPYVLSTDKYLLLMKGNDMYYYNYASPGDGVSFYWHFDAPVKHMTASVQGHPQLGCALANGQFVILNVKLIKNRPEEKRLYWQTPAEVDLGNPVSLIYKTSGQL